MIKEVNNDDLKLIRELENNFSFVLNNVEEDLVNNPFSHYVVYLDNEKILGYINYYLMYDRAEIANFNVLDKYQHKGIGTKLLNYVINFLEDKVNNITLEVKIDNPAIELYKKVGFIKVSERKGYYKGIDGVLMERKMVMKDVYILGIESSCDETSFSIVKNGSEEIATVISSQIDIHKDYGGVVPEIASREHVKCITVVIEECLEKAKMKMEDIMRQM